MFTIPTICDPKIVPKFSEFVVKKMSIDDAVYDYYKKTESPTPSCVQRTISLLSSFSYSLKFSSPVDSVGCSVGSCVGCSVGASVGFCVAQSVSFPEPKHASRYA